MAVRRQDDFGDYLYCDSVNGKGRGLLSRKSIGVGVEILREEPLFYISSGSTVCDFCLRENEHCKRCAACKLVWYCSQSCQKSAWKVHKLECSHLKNIPSPPTGELPHQSFRFVGRSLLLGQKEIDGSLLGMQDMESHLNLYARNTEAVSSLMFITAKYLGAGVALDEHIIVSAAAKLACNSMSVYNAELQNVGTALYSRLSKINHSCEPNCVVIFEGPLGHLRSIRPISENEEITISYIDVLNTTEVRRQQLEKQFYFWCTCPVCAKSSGDCKDDVSQLQVSLLTSQSVVASASTACSVCREDSSFPMAWNSEEAALATLASVKERLAHTSCGFGDYSPGHCRLKDAASDCCVALKRYADALFFSTATLAVHRLYYGVRHPSVGIQLLRVGKLCLAVDRDERAAGYFKEALAILQASHGDTHPLVRENVETYMGLLQQLQNQR